MSATVIQQTLDLWEKEPAKAKGNPIVKARTEGAETIVESGPFTWRCDLPASLGGKNEGPNPTMLLLGALAGCAAVFIQATLAPQLGIHVNSVNATAQCKADARGLLGMQGAIPDLQDIELNIEIDSGEPEEKIQVLYRTWQERCPIYLALIKSMSVKTSVDFKSS